MKEKIFAELVRRGNVVRRVQISVAIFDENRITLRKFNELSKAARDSFNLKKGEYINIVTESGKKPGPNRFCFVQFE